MRSFWNETSCGTYLQPPLISGIFYLTAGLTWKYIGWKWELTRMELVVKFLGTHWDRSGNYQGWNFKVSQIELWWSWDYKFLQWNLFVVYLEILRFTAGWHSEVTGMTLWMELGTKFDEPIMYISVLATIWNGAGSLLKWILKTSEMKLGWN